MCLQDCRTVKFRDLCEALSAGFGEYGDRMYMDFTKDIAWVLWSVL